MLTSPLTSASPTVLEIERYMPLVRQVVARVLRRVPPSVQRDDLLSAAVCGLVDCLRRNDGSTGVAFEAYARIRIHGAVVDELRKHAFVPRHQRSREEAPRVVWMEDLSPDASPSEFEDPSAVNAAAFLEDMQDARALSEAIDMLPAREALIIRMRYFESKTVREIATELALSDPRVSQLHARAIARLREAMRT